MEGERLTIEKTKFGWLIPLAIAAVGVSTSARAAATGAFVCLQKSNKVCTQWGALPSGGSGHRGRQVRQGRRGLQAIRLYH